VVKIKTVKRLKDIEGLFWKEKNIDGEMIDMPLVYSKTEKALAE
jgi:hypothetical protein